MGIFRLNHAVLFVRDVERSVAFYHGVLGFERIDMTPEGFRAASSSRSSGWCPRTCSTTPRWNPARPSGRWTSTPRSPATVLTGRIQAAGRMLTELAAMPGGRARWRLALDSADDVVGIVLPTRNPSSATIGYLGVVPAHRGRHYVDDLVAEALGQFAADEEPVVNDATDAANEPMVAAFNRRGYRVTGRQVIMI